MRWCDDSICVYLRDLRAICDGAMSSVSICVICGLQRLCDGTSNIDSARERAPDTDKDTTRGGLRRDGLALGLIDPIAQ